MSRMWWIIVLVAAGVGLAVVIGILGTRNEPSGPSKSEAVSSLCGSLTSLGTSLKNLTSLQGSASKSDYDSDVNAVKGDWSQVKSDLQDVKNAPGGDLENAWNGFASALKGVPDAASVQEAVGDVTDAANQLVTTAKTTASQVNCTGS